MLKVLFVLGTRPEAIKLAPLIHRVAQQPDCFTLRVCVTAQHREMLDQALELFRIQPDYDLNVMQDNQSPTQVTAAVLSKLEAILKMEKPDWVLVQGDTTSAASAAWAAFHAGAKVAHVEAGLRTGDKWQPFPEELNRRLISIVADLHFAPTEQSRQNLLNENVEAKHIRVTGNPVVDALRWALQNEPGKEIIALLGKLREPAAPEMSINHYHPARARTETAMGIRKIILVTAHRRENFGQPLENVCEALRSVVGSYGNRIQIVFVVHPNPNLAGLVNRMLGNIQNVTLLSPLDYVSMAHLLNKSYLVVTDSGGLQEEATSLGKPVLVIRKVTDRPESVAAGTARVVGVERETIIKQIEVLLDDATTYRAMSKTCSVFGEGQAAAKIIAALMSFQS